MSAEGRCCFCRRLPPLPSRRLTAGVAARCPACKCRLVRTPDETYRDDGGPAAGTSRPRRRLAWTACAVGSLAALTAAGGFLVKSAPPATPHPRPSAGLPVARAEEARP